MSTCLQLRLTSSAVTEFWNFTCQSRKLMQKVSNLTRVCMKPLKSSNLIRTCIKPLKSFLDSHFSTPCYNFRFSLADVFIVPHHVHHTCISRALPPVPNKNCNQIRTRWSQSIFNRCCLPWSMVGSNKHKQTKTNNNKWKQKTTKCPKWRKM